MKRFAFLIVCLCCISSVSAATYYLDAINGNDTTGDGSNATPWASMAKVFTVVSPGDTVLLKPGNYGSVTFEENAGLGDSTGHVTYMADPATTTPRAANWYNGAPERPDPADPDDKVIFTEIIFYSYVENWDSVTATGDPVGHYVTLEGINVVGENISMLSYVSHVTLRDCNIFGTWGEYYPQISDTAIAIYHSSYLGSNYRHILIEDCYGRDCRGGVMLTGNCYDITVRGCHFHHFSGSAIALQAGTKENIVFDGNHCHDWHTLADTHPINRTVVSADASEPNRIFTLDGGADHTDFVTVTDVDTNIDEVRAVASFNTTTYEVVVAEPFSFAVESGDAAVLRDGTHGSGLSIRAGGFTFKNNILRDCGGSRGIYMYNVDDDGYSDMTIENNLIYSITNQYTVDFVNSLGDNCVIRNNTIAGRIHENYYSSSGLYPHYYYGFGMMGCDAAPNTDPSTITIANNLIVGLATAPEGAVVKNNIVYASDDYETDSVGDNANNIVYYNGQTVGNEPHPFDGSGNFFVGGGLFDTLAFKVQHEENFNDAFQLVSTAPAVGYGNISLATSTDITGQTRDMTPDVGAYECDSPGSNGTIANAGDDQIIEDADDTGSETVQLNGSGSFATVGTIVSYVWTENTIQIATGATPSVSLGVGTHEITLTITDSNSFYDTDVVVVTIDPMDTELIVNGDFEDGWGGSSILGSDVTRPVTVDSTGTSDWETIMVGDWVRELAGNWHVAPAGTGNDSSYAAGLRKTYGTVQVLEDNMVTIGSTLLLNWDYHVPTGLAADTTFTVRIFGVNEAGSGETATQFNNFSTTINDSTTVTGESSNFSEIFNMSVTVVYDDATNGTWQSATEQQISIVNDWDYLVVIFGRNAGPANLATIQMDNISLEIYSQPNSEPVADAGSDQTVLDSDDSGSESVQLDGSGSSDSDGTIVSYIWSEGGNQIATGATPTVTLSVGTHTIDLVVTDDDDDTDSDTVVVTVVSGGNLLTYGDFETSWASVSILGSDVTLPVIVDTLTTSDWETIMIEDWVRELAGNWNPAPAGTGNDSDNAAGLRKTYGTAQALPLGEIESGDSLVLNWDYHVPTGLVTDTTFAFRLFGVNEAGSGESATQFNNFSTTVSDSTTVTGESANFDEIFNTTLTVDCDDITNGTWQSASQSQISVNDSWDYLVLIFGMSSGMLNNSSIQIDNISLTRTVPAENGMIDGDIDNNGLVDIFDFLILKINYGATVATYEMGDINGDGTVNIYDFLILKANYSKK